MACSPLLSEEDLSRFRTKPCRRLIKGGCDFGIDRCQYSHNKYWNRRCPVYLSDGSFIRYIPCICPYVTVNSSELDGFCFSGNTIITNNCSRGGECPFAHSEEEIFYHPLFYKRTECENYKKGQCTTYYCPFIHGLAEGRPLKYFKLPFTQGIHIPFVEGVVIVDRIEYDNSKGNSSKSITNEPFPSYLNPLSICDNNLLLNKLGRYKNNNNNNINDSNNHNRNSNSNTNINNNNNNNNISYYNNNINKNVDSTNGNIGETKNAINYYWNHSIYEEDNHTNSDNIKTMNQMHLRSSNNCNIVDKNVLLLYLKYSGRPTVLGCSMIDAPEGKWEDANYNSNDFQVNGNISQSLSTDIEVNSIENNESKLPLHATNENSDLKPISNNRGKENDVDSLVVANDYVRVADAKSIANCPVSTSTMCNISKNYECSIDNSESITSGIDSRKSIGVELEEIIVENELQVNVMEALLLELEKLKLKQSSLYLLNNANPGIPFNLNYTQTDQQTGRSSPDTLLKSSSLDNETFVTNEMDCQTHSYSNVLCTSSNRDRDVDIEIERAVECSEDFQHKLLMDDKITCSPLIEPFGITKCTERNNSDSYLLSKKVTNVSLISESSEINNNLKSDAINFYNTIGNNFHLKNDNRNDDTRKRNMSSEEEAKTLINKIKVISEKHSETNLFSKEDWSRIGQFAFQLLNLSAELGKNHLFEYQDRLPYIREMDGGIDITDANND